MALLVFTLVFVALGLGVLFVALSGGPSGARRRMASQTRRTRRVALVNFVLAVVILGLAIPSAVIARVETRKDIRQSIVSRLTPAESHGLALFVRRCRTCHTLKAANA